MRCESSAILEHLLSGGKGVHCLSSSGLLQASVVLEVEDAVHGVRGELSLPATLLCGGFLQNKVGTFIRRI